MQKSPPVQLNWPNDQLLNCCGKLWTGANFLPTALENNQFVCGHNSRTTGPILSVLSLLFLQTNNEVYPPAKHSQIFFINKSLSVLCAVQRIWRCGETIHFGRTIIKLKIDSISHSREKFSTFLRGKELLSPSSSLTSRKLLLVFNSLLVFVGKLTISLRELGWSL